jgi:hypothetical protein
LIFRVGEGVPWRRVVRITRMDTVVRAVCVFSATLNYKQIRKIRNSEGQTGLVPTLQHGPTMTCVVSTDGAKLALQNLHYSSWLSWPGDITTRIQTLFTIIQLPRSGSQILTKPSLFMVAILRNAHISPYMPHLPPRRWTHNNTLSQCDNAFVFPE